MVPGVMHQSFLANGDKAMWAESEDFRKSMAGRLSSRMAELRRERDVEFAAAPSREGVGTALILVTDKLAQRNPEFGTPKYRTSKMEVRDQMAAHKGTVRQSFAIEIAFHPQLPLFLLKRSTAVPDIFWPSSI